ncbi:MAG: hypothetical protein KGJ77_01025 [Acidobacteriota bacterium]|nr:hypothetical protein [Acidobacteriota bacterium]
MTASHDEGGAMAHRVRRTASVASMALVAGLLAACGTTPAAARHVVRPPTTAAYPAQGAAPSSTDPLESPAAQQAVADVQSSLGAVDSGLAQVDTDLSRPQADS